MRVFGNVGKDGMIIDFGELKGIIKHHFDHKLFIPKEDAPAWREALEILALPDEIVVFDGPPTAENIAKKIYEVLKQYFPDCDFSFALYEGPNEGVWIG